MNRLIYAIKYVPAVRIQSEDEQRLVLESIRNRVWNPVFTIGTISFVLSMTLRGFFDQHYATPVLGISAFVLFWGVWILSATALVVIDRPSSTIYFIYRHLGYLQKVYTVPISSIDAVLLQKRDGRLKMSLLRDTGANMAVGHSRDDQLLSTTAQRTAAYLGVPLQESSTAHSS
ncbi:MAG: hypothetical protein NZL95_00350 [Chitinophagales bacterium]|nr:hypothetical protein [Chitinophagales bacterium]MDW8426991.1 hypothetical protein [Chitinophagales bacterium]